MMMLEELRQKEAEFKSRLVQVGEFLKVEEKEEELAALEEKMNAPDFWNDKEAAQETISAVSSCRNIITPYRKMESALEDFVTALELAAEDEAFAAEAEALLPDLSAELDKLEIVSFLSGRFDRNNFYLTIHAGAGGTESCDWARNCKGMQRSRYRYREHRPLPLPLPGAHQASG